MSNTKKETEEFWIPELKQIDYLTEMLKIQKEFQDKAGYYPLIKDIASAIMAEGGELWMGAGGKWWKTYIEGKDRWHKMTPEEIVEYIREVEEQNQENIDEELIDILHFWLVACLVRKLDAKKIFQIYFKKMGINIDRRETGY